MTDVIVDTDILIDALRNIPEAVTYVSILEQQYTLGISSVTHMELLIGCRNKIEQQHIAQFVQRFQIAKVNETINDYAIALLETYRLSHGLLIADALIAASKLAIQKPIATKNQRDYRFITGLVVLPYP